GHVLLTAINGKTGKTEWQIKHGKALDLFAAVAVSVPFELAKCADRMDRGFSRIYRNLLLADLNRYMALKYRHLVTKGWHEEARKIEAMGDLSRVRSFWEYDDRVIAPLYGFKNALDYYVRCSSRRYLRGVAVPTLLLHALDDPFLSADVVPDPDELPAPVRLDVSSRGGHVGFIAGTRPGRSRYWLEQKIPEFLFASLEEYSGTSRDSASIDQTTRGKPLTASGKI
ncbi:MAG: YheT family hydrolase, partial [Gammaproteobacteria bacterium]